MVTKNELRKREEKVERILGQRRQHNVDLVTAQV